MSDPGKAARPMSMALSAALESSSSERDLMVKEILVSEAAYVANLDKLIAVRAPHSTINAAPSSSTFFLSGCSTSRTHRSHKPHSCIYLRSITSVLHVSLLLHLCSVRTR